MKKDIIISFVIPAYNSEKTIIRTLKSFNYEKKDNFEVIIVNDGSTDNTVKITNE
jgi:glycosyltransferase involved in cell wall biosynthesis